MPEDIARERAFFENYIAVRTALTRRIPPRTIKAFSARFFNDWANLRAQRNTLSRFGGPAFDAMDNDVLNMYRVVNGILSARQAAYTAKGASDQKTYIEAIRECRLGQKMIAKASFREMAQIFGDKGQKEQRELIEGLDTPDLLRHVLQTTRNLIKIHKSLDPYSSYLGIILGDRRKYPEGIGGLQNMLRRERRKLADATKKCRKALLSRKIPIRVSHFLHSTKPSNGRGPR